MATIDITDWLMEQNDCDFAERRETLFKNFDKTYGHSPLYLNTYSIAYDLLCEEANLSPTTCKVVNNLIELWQKEKEDENHIDIYQGRFKLYLNSLPPAVKFYVYLKENEKIMRHNVSRNTIEDEFKQFNENNTYSNFSSILFAMTFLGLARVYNRNSVKIFYTNSLSL